MTDPGKMLLALICYASDSGKPALLKIRPETISLLCAVGLIEEREDGHWITALGRKAAFSPGRFSLHVSDVEKELMGISAASRPLDQAQAMETPGPQDLSQSLGDQDLPASPNARGE